MEGPVQLFELIAESEPLQLVLHGSRAEYEGCLGVSSARSAWLLGSQKIMSPTNSRDPRVRCFRFRLVVLAPQQVNQGVIANGRLVFLEQPVYDLHRSLHLSPLFFPVGVPFPSSNQLP
jgi:hypothetical protein